jgi:hypothetical protein
MGWSVKIKAFAKGADRVTLRTSQERSTDMTVILRNEGFRNITLENKEEPFA